MICMGGIAMMMFILRFFCFTLYESPKFLMGRGMSNYSLPTVLAVTVPKVCTEKHGTLAVK